jgi:tetratricopeptide (TPR) repeat protein
MQVRFVRVVVLVLGLALMTTACGRYSWSSLRSSKDFQDGLKAYQKADYRAAIEEFEASVASNPDFPAAGFAYFYLGNSHDSMYKAARKGEPENDAHLAEAVEYYRKAIDKLATSDVPQAKEFHKRSYEYLISAYGTDKLADFSKAEPIAQELISIEPNEPGNYQALGRLYEDEAEFEKAEAMFVKAIEVRPSDPTGYQLLAGFYNRRGEFDKTMAAFQRRAEMEPNNPEAWHTIGTYNYDKVANDKQLSRDLKRKYIDAGLAAEDKALALNNEFLFAVVFKGLLIRAKAATETNPATQRALMAEAEKLTQRAEELKEKQEGSAAAGS